jgi:hypothetical protein
VADTAAIASAEADSFTKVMENSQVRLRIAAAAISTRRLGSSGNVFVTGT